MTRCRALVDDALAVATGKITAAGGPPTPMTNDDRPPKRPLPAVKGAHFSGLISEVGPGEWRAFAWVRKPDQTLEQTIGPQILATVPLARQWLSLVAASHGFENFDVVVERLADEDLVPEDDA
jgi:hypothetical protein